MRLDALTSDPARTVALLVALVFTLAVLLVYVCA
jgi:hypothetical protein